MASTTATTTTATFALTNPNLSLHHHHHHLSLCFNPGRPWLGPPALILRCGSHPFVTRAGRSNEGGGAADANSKLGMEAANNNVSSGEGYVALFVRMLGLDNDPLDREHAVITLWKYSQGGRKCIDGIMQYPGCINLVVSLLKSDSCSTCEAAAGLLRTVSSVSLYRDNITEDGAVEEMLALLHQASLTPEVKEQSLCTLWNLSIDEKLRVKLANDDILPLLVKFLDDEDIKVKEAAGGILANLSLSACNHSLLVEASVIPKLAGLLKNNANDSKVIRKEAKTTLLELSKDEYYRILIIEEGLLRVPVVGVAAYKSFRSPSHSWPSLPDGTEFERNSRPSRFGASELLLGLTMREKKFNLEETKMNAIVGRSQQQFLARIGAIELESGKESQVETSRNEQYTILPLYDGVARLVLILSLEDISAIKKAAYSIAETSISERLRISFKEAGAIKRLVQLLSNESQDLQEAAAHALERLCVSNEVCTILESEAVLSPLITIIKNRDMPRSLIEKAVSILSRIFDLGKQMKRKPESEVVNGLKGELDPTSRMLETGTDGLRSMEGLPISEAPRMKIIDSSVISRLIDMLRTESPSLQTKAASVLEYISTFELNAMIIAASNIESGLSAVFRQASLDETEGTIDEQLELDAYKAEEIGLAIAASSRLLTKLLSLEQFRHQIYSTHLVHELQKILKSTIPLHAKNWAAACLVKFESLINSGTDLEKPFDVDVTIHEIIPRLVEQMRTGFSLDSRESACVELNRVISGGGVQFTRAVADAGGIFPLVELLEEGNGKALEASLAILYNLSMDSENHPAILSAGAVPVLKRMVLSKGQQWARALSLLRALPT